MGETTAAKRHRHTSSESNKSSDSVGQYIPTPPDGGWGWVIVFASLICNIIVDGINYSFGVFMLEFANYFGETKSKTSLVGSLLCGMYLMTGPIVSALVNKFGCRPVTVAGSLIATLAFLLSTQSHSIEVLILTYGVMGGMGFGLIYLPSIVSVGYYFEKRRALATGIAVCGSGIGTFIFAPLSQYLLQEFDWKNAMFIIAGIVLHGTVCGMLMRPLEPPRRRKRRPRTKNIVDRVKEQCNSKNGRPRSESESNMQALGVKDTNRVLLMEAKLLREKQLQEDESEVGSIPSAYFLKSLSGDGQTHKLSMSDKGEQPSSPTSPESAPKIVVGNSCEISVSPTSERPLSVEGVHEVSSLQEETGESNKAENNNVGNTDEMDGATPKRGSEKSNSTTRSSTRGSHSTMTSDHALCNGPMVPTGRERCMTDGFHSRSHSVKSDSKYIVNGGTGAHEVLPLLARSEAGIDRITDAHKKTAEKGAAVWRPGNRLRVEEKVPSFHKEDYARPLYRKDIFYSGSILNIPQFQSQPDMRSYITSITTIPGTLAHEKITTSIWDRCTCLPKSARDTLGEMLDMSLLSNTAFMLICLGNVFAMAGFLVPFVYLVDRTQLLGIDENRAAFLISVIGITNTVGRLLAGFLADLPWVDSLVVNNVALVVAGVASGLAPFCVTYPLLVTFSCVFGLCMAAFISLTSIILCDLLGLEKLTNAFGLLTMARGVSAIAGPPLTGAIYDMTQSYDGAFYVGGGIILTGALLHCFLHLPCIKRNKGQPDRDNEVFVEDNSVKVSSTLRVDDTVTSV